jgi:hypothetical protein
MAAIIYDLSGRAFAQELGVDEKAVRKARLKGDIKFGYNAVSGKYNLEEAKKNQWVQEQFLVKPKAGVNKAKAIDKLEKLEKKGGDKSAGVSGRGQQPPNDEPEEGPDEDLNDCTVEELTKRLKVTSNMPARKALQYTQIVELARAKLKLQQEAGVLVAKVDVEKQLFAKGRILKADVMNIAENTVDDVLAAPNRVEAINILKQYCTNLLERYSNEEQLNINNEE